MDPAAAPIALGLPAAVATLPAVVVLVAVVLVAALVGAAALRHARVRRARDLRTLTAVGRAVAAHAGGDRTDCRLPVVAAVRDRLDAARVLLVVDGHVVLAGAPLPAGAPPVTTALAAGVPAHRSAAAWTRRGAPADVRAGLRERDAEEVLVVPVRSGDAVVGALEVHDPRRPWWSARRAGRTRPRAGVRGELALLGTLGRHLAAAVDNERLESRLRRDAHHDPLTGLLNREGFLAAAAEQLAEGLGAVAVVDFALLDQVNDTLGHARGERFVLLAAERLAEVCAGRRATAVAPQGRVAARLEGDTFAVVVAGIDPGTAHRSAVEMRTRLAQPYVVEGVPFEAPVVVGVAANVGSAAALGGAERVAALLRRADVALTSTRDGGESVGCYEPSMGERAARRLALIRGFATGVAEGQVTVHYQPTVSLGERTVVGVEALARWEHPDLGLLLPDEFVPVLEATGQIGELTRVVLDEALAATRRWLDHGMRLSVAVNLSVGDLDDPTFPDHVAARLSAHDVPADLLTLELTESGVSSERDVALPVLRRLHAMGCRLAVDDFGTGQSSLAHLRRLPVDQVKIDKSFVLGMGTELGDVAVVRAIVEMGHTLGLTVVAEGVERPAVRATLTEMGCDVAQGYLVSRPLPARCLDRWLESLDVRPGVPGAEEGPRTLIA